MRPFILLFVTLCLVISCRSAKKEYNRGKYESAIKKSLKDLRSDKKSRESKSIFNKALIKYVNNILKDNKRASDVEDKESVYNRMMTIVDYYTDGSEFLDNTNITKAQEIDSLSTDLRLDIIDDLYLRGNDNLSKAYQQDNKQLAQAAYRDFTNLERRYNPDIPDLEDLIGEALTKAMMVIVFKIDHNFNIMERSDIDRQFSNLEGTSGYTTVFVDRGPDEIDCLIELDFDRLDENQSRRSERRNFQKQVEDGFTLEKDTNGNEVKVPKYKTIKGYVDINTIRYTLSWDLSADVQRSSRHCNKYDRNFNKERYQDIITYQQGGDINAVPAEYRNNRTQRYDRNSLVDALLDDLYDDVRRYYL